MATCPKCMGFLGENHRCPRGPLSRMADALSTVLVGSVVGAGLCWAYDINSPGALVVATAALGGVLASAVRQAVTGRS